MKKLSAIRRLRLLQLLLVDAVKKKKKDTKTLLNSLCQHIVDFVHFMAWDDAKLFKIEAYNCKPRKTFFIN